MNKITRSDISAVIADLCLQGKTTGLPHKVAAYLLEQRRVGDLDSILRDVQKYWAGKGYVDVLARVAHPLPAHIYAEATNL